jgi:hypothetical protein
MNWRRRWIVAGTVVCVSILFLVGTILAQEAAKETAAKAATPSFNYVGSAKCKMCHMTAKSGAQFKLWQESRHSKAFETLSTPKAEEVAKAKGLTVPAAQAPECLACHVTAHGKAAEMRGGVTDAEGIGCEACHGPGSEYQKMAVMKQLVAGEVEPASVGLVEPTEALCKTCHNEKSPTYKPFDFKTASAKIAHPTPKAEAAPTGAAK